MPIYIVLIAKPHHVPQLGKHSVSVAGEMNHFIVDEVFPYTDQSILVELTSRYTESVTRYMIQQTLHPQAQIIKVWVEAKIGSVIL
jgi:hypothetical protein